MITFEIIHQSAKSKARVGRIQTPHGVIETPTFVPVATNAAIKAVEGSILNQLGIHLMFCNTYHLLLHPGPEVIAEAGGLHAFMGCNNALITDSGGFQVFSLAYGSVHSELKSRGLKKGANSVISVTEDGVIFKSYRDGTTVLLTPESSVQTQKKLGADLIIPLDELPPYHIDARALRRSLERTHRWEARSLEEHRKNPQQQAMLAVIHGGVDPLLRRESAQFLSKLPFDGFAIGGSLGKTKDELFAVVEATVPHLADEKPRHLLGIGDPASIDRCIPLGIDSFDSSYPTKCARHGILFTATGAINITRSAWKHEHRPISQEPFCKEYTAAYLHHLFKAHEPVAHTLASIHNISFMVKRMAAYRERILNNDV